jgi:hypothetical protein
VSPSPSDHERRGPRTPLDDVYNFVPLTRDEVARFVEHGLGDALRPRLWRADPESDEAVEIDGVEVAAIEGRPAFFVGMRKPPKPVSPFGVDRTWLRACVFLDPDTLQCRIHETDVYPNECAEYPGHNLSFGRETECERVEAAFGGDRLLDDSAPDDLRGLLLGPHAVGAKVFAHPDPDGLDGVVERLQDGALTPADRATFVATAVGSRPGTVEVNADRIEAARATVVTSESWAGSAIDEWTTLAGVLGTAAANAPDGARVEGERDAPETPGWMDTG